jgi:hypothetical protein
MPRILLAPHAIDTYRSRVLLSDCQVVTNRVLWMYAAQSGLGRWKLPQLSAMLLKRSTTLAPEDETERERCTG